MTTSKDTTKMAGDNLPDSRKIAIVGIGCRFANGINDVTDFVRMLREGLDCTGEPPADRYDAEHFYRPGKSVGKMYNQRGGYIRDDLEAFDRQFFKMPPEEANALDPQVRLLLEVSWEGMENAGLPASTMRGSNTGVYMGVTTSEYAALTTNPMENISQYTNSGTNSCMVANRISYEFDLHGPSFSIDTACSSSLYAIHLACEAIRSGDCEMALAGGVTLLLTPISHIGFCQAGMLSPDGRCKSFDNSADGYARSEGAGVVLLKPLEKAVKDGDNIYAVIRGGALSNDGHTPGIVNPSYDAQLNLVYRACKQAKVDPHAVEYIEAHGTGTKVGDKTEANALGKALGKNRSLSDPSLYLGSVKSNFGHTEGAAGVAGIIKVALMQKFNFIAPVVHFKNGNENIAFEELKLKVPTQALEWPRPQEGVHRISGCSSFGFGGANAHMILEEPPVTMATTSQSNSSPKNKPNVIFISAASKEALLARKIQFSRLFENIAKEGGDLTSIAATSFQRAHHHRHRCVLVARSAEEAVARLQAANEKTPGLVEGSASEPGSLSKVAFVFTGMGSQWWAMGQKLMERESFNSCIKRFDSVIASLGATWTVHQLLTAPSDRNMINQTEYAQPAICAVEMALFHVLRDFGVTPDAIVGHSVGEVAAAYASGMLAFEDAVKIIYHRGQELRKTSGRGKMVVALHPVEDIIKQLQQSKQVEAIDIAAVNSPTQIVLSGDSDAIDSFTEILKADGIRTVLLKVNNAFHSFQQEQIKDSLMEKFSFLGEGTSDKHIPMMSTVTVNYVTKQQLNDKQYWWSNVRQKVNFFPAIQKLLQEGYSTFVEVGPHPALSPAVLDIIRDQKEAPSKPLVVGTLQRPRDVSGPTDDTGILLQNLGRLHCEGYQVDFTPTFPEKYNVQQLPLYPWQRVRCSAVTKAAKEVYTFPRTSHYLLGKKEDPSPGKSKLTSIWNSEWTMETVPWIMDHIIQDSVIAPGTSYLETALEAAREMQDSQMPLTLAQVDLQRFLFMPECKATVQVVVEEDGKDQRFSIYSKGGKQTWSKHATGLVVPPIESPVQQTLDIQDIIEKCHGDEGKDRAYLYGTFSGMGFDLQSSFHGIRRAWFSKDLNTAYTIITATEEIENELGLYNLHPAMMDSLLQGFGTTVVLQQERKAEELKIKHKPILHIPLHIQKVQVLRPVKGELYVQTKLRGMVHADIEVADSTGAVVFKMEGVEFGKASNVDEDSELDLWKFDWEEIEAPSAAKDQRQNQTPNSAEILVISSSEKMESMVDQVSNGLKADFLTFGNSEDLNMAKVMAKYPQMKHLLFVASHESQPMNGSPSTAQEFTDQVDKTCVALTKIAQQLTMSSRKDPPQLWIITRGAHAIHKNNMVNPMAYAVQSMGVSFIHEALNLRTIMVDLPTEDREWNKSLQMVKILLQSPPATENELAIREDESRKMCLFGRRLSRKLPSGITHLVPNNKWAVKQDAKNKGLTLIPHHPTQSPDGQLVVKVTSFRMLEASTPDKFNAIIAGNVTKGSGQFLAGDAVVAFVQDPVQAYTAIDPHNCAKVPDWLNHVQAVEVIHRYFMPFVTCHACNLNGSRVALVGNTNAEKQAFKQLLESFQCEVHETLDQAEDDGKYDAVILLPGEDTILAAEFMKKLEMFGRFVYVADSGNNKDEKVNQLLTKSIFNPVIQMPRCLSKTHSIAQTLDSFLPSLFNKVEGDFSNLLPEISSVFLADAAGSYVSDVIVVDERPVRVQLANKDNMFEASPEATYIITGASKGFGVEVIEWLHRSGARKVVGFSRSTPQGDDLEKVELMKKNGLDLEWKKVDVANVTSVYQAVKEVKNGGRPIEGIFHCAAVYRDVWLSSLEQKDWHDVMLPKAFGAHVLHQVATDMDLPLKQFVMFSSIVGVVGSAGQTNYCAANSFLYSLGEMRRHNGLPATVASFGTINSTGFAARNDLIKTWEEKGLGSVSPATALNMVGMMIDLDIPHLGITGQFTSKSYYQHSRPQVSEHLSEPEGKISRWKSIFTHDLLQGSKRGMEQEILEETPAQAREIIHRELASFLADRLGISDPDSITLDNPPTSYGLDSLLSSDMSNYISEKFHIAVLPVELLNDKNTIGKLVGSIYDKIVAKNSSAGVTEEEHPKFVNEETLTNPDAVVICFPPNGGGLSSYRGWHKQLAAKNIQMYVAQMPGWEGTNGGRPMAIFPEIVDSLTREILPLIEGRNFTFYGHSFGALFAFEVAHKLRSIHGIYPSNLFLGAWYSPIDPYIRPMEATPKMFDPNTPIEEAMQMARCFTFLEDEVLNTVSVMKRALPCIEACLTMLEEYRYSYQEDHLPSNLTVYAGKSDRFLPPDHIRRWDQVMHADHKFKLNVVNASHMFILDPKCQEQIITDIVNSLISGSH